MNWSTRHLVVAGALLLCTSSSTFAKDIKQKNWNECSLDTLEGTYVFSATGYSLIGGVWQPKAIVEHIQFNGDGTLTVPAATVANRAGDGAVAQSPPGGTGIYTLGEDCKGTLQFTPGPSFDVFASPKGLQLTLIQTNPNNVLQGNARRVWR
jgi:hypothetical protein